MRIPQCGLQIPNCLLKLYAHDDTSIVFTSIPLFHFQDFYIISCSYLPVLVLVLPIILILVYGYYSFISLKILNVFENHY